MKKQRSKDYEKGFFDGHRKGFDAGVFDENQRIIMLLLSLVKKLERKKKEASE